MEDIKTCMVCDRLLESEDEYHETEDGYICIYCSGESDDFSADLHYNSPEMPLKEKGYDENGRYYEDY